MELTCLILLIFGVTTTALRLSCTDRAWPTGLATLVWTSLPWLTEATAARASAARIREWVLASDHTEGLAAILMIEAVIGGWAALRRVGREAERLDGRLTASRSAMGFAPSPALAFGIVGCQVALFHRVAGWAFSRLTATISATVGIALLGLVFMACRLQPDPERRASLAVLLYSGLFLAGASLPPLAHQPPFPTAGGEIDSRGLLVAAAVTTAGLSIGLANREWRSLRKGAKSQ